MKQEVDDDLSVCMDQGSPCGLSITGDIKFINAIWSKGNDITTPNGEVLYELLSKLFLMPKFDNYNSSVSRYLPKSCDYDIILSVPSVAE